MVFQDRLLGCILAGAVGDASTSAFEGTVGQDWPGAEPWRLTDDTQLTLATCESIAAGRKDPESIAAELLRCYRSRRLRGVGASTLKALRDLHAGAHWALAGRKGEYAAGNGAAMRVAPLALVTDGCGLSSRQLIRDVCRITHHSEEAYVGGLAVVLAVRQGLWKGTVIKLDSLAEQLPDSVVRDRLHSLAACGVEFGVKEAAAKVGSTGYVAESVPLALFSASLVPAHGWMSVFQQLVEVGGDCDTNASITGQVAGAALGLSSVPVWMLERLREREEITLLCQRLLQSVLANT